MLPMHDESRRGLDAHAALAKKSGFATLEGNRSVPSIVV